MKKKYVEPVIEKIEFDYTVQTATSNPCHVTNIRTSEDECGSGTVVYDLFL